VLHQHVYHESTSTVSVGTKGQDPVSVGNTTSDALSYSCLA